MQWRIFWSLVEAGEALAARLWEHTHPDATRPCVECACVETLWAATDQAVRALCQ